MQLSKLGDVSYLAAITLWSLLAIAFPPWVGIYYLQDARNAGSFTRKGSFGLKPETGPNTSVTPFWYPPRAHSPDIQAFVRWPWQPPSHEYHVEISMARLTLRWVGGAVLLGLAFAVYILIAPSRRVSFIRIGAIALTTALLLAYVTIIGMAMLTMGYAPGDDMILPIVLVSVVLGGVIGLIVFFIRCGKTRHNEMVNGPSP